MLVLTRKVGESIQIGETVTLRVERVAGNRVKLVVDAPRSVPVHRSEIWERMLTEPSFPVGLAPAQPAMVTG